MIFGIIRPAHRRRGGGRAELAGSGFTKSPRFKLLTHGRKGTGSLISLIYAHSNG